MCFIKQLFYFSILFQAHFSFAQFTDDFSSGNLTSDPEWFGETERFSIENEELRLTAPAEADQSYLVTESQSIEDATWEFYLRMTFQPSGTNYARVYLVADQSNLKGVINGYFVQIGDTPRDISLYRQNGTSTTKIIDGIDGRVASNPVEVRVKVTRDEIGNWELFSDTLGGNDYFLEGSTFDETFIQGFYTGVYCRYTATRSDRFYFDDFVVTGEPYFDPFAPELLETTVLSSNSLEVTFDKVITENSASETNNFNVNLGIGNPASAQRDESNATKVILTFDTNFEVGTVYTLTTSNLQDLFGNLSEETSKEFQFIEAQEPEFGDIIINEFMPRESPSAGLAERQYVELYNRSDKYFHLNGWQLSDRTGSGTIQDEWLFPGEYLLLVPTSGLEDYPTAINVTNWQSLNNSGDDIVLSTPDWFTVDSISYTNEWYQDSDKSNGGYSIERINPTLPCAGTENWMASQNPLGGTPGEENSVFDSSPDLTPPSLIDALTISEDTVRLNFNKGMDAESLLNASITIEPELSIAERFVEFTYPKELFLVAASPILPNIAYRVQLDNVSDCSGNSSDVETLFFLPDTADSGDIIINEILHNNLTGGSDFVELYNRSEKYIDLIDWQLGNHSNDTVANIRTIETNYILAPDDYVVITRDSSFQLANYPFAVSGKFIQLASLPSYTNDSSTVYLVHNNQVMDKVSYTSDWHFRLLSSIRGISLERFDPDGPSNDKNNWHSASETVGFATPGRTNSQINRVSAEGKLSLSGNSFSPDHDGIEDVLLITYQLTDPEMVGSLKVYDDKGRLTATLLSNHLMGIEGTIKWDGVRDDGNKASIGPYIILFEALNATNGESIAIRKVVTVAGKL